jgi:hypothetical protein
MPRPRLLPAVILALLTASPMVPVAAGTAEAAAPPAPPWQFEWNARLRQETVDDDAFARQASATTLRLRAGLRLHWADGFSALLEGEGIADAGDRYNSGANGQVLRPAVTDPEGIELNQAFVAWKGAQGGGTVGRQRLQFDNQRWIGNSGWRQNEQTFDALSTDWRIAPSLSLRYAWLDGVHRVNGDQALDRLARKRALSTHLLNLGWTLGAQQLVGYAYLHDDRDVAAASTATFGARWSGARLHAGNGFGWTLEAAHQRDYADNPLSFSHAYWLLEPSYASHGVTYRAGWEHLGGNGAHALQTPLATLHAFNGWADKFTVTPPGGLEDRYLGAGGKLGRAAHAGKYNWAVSWHDYRADQAPAGTDGHYGSEWDASFGFPVHGAVAGLVKLADYRADAFARDTRKLWLQLEWTQ